LARSFDQSWSGRGQIAVGRDVVVGTPLQEVFGRTTVHEVVVDERSLQCVVVVGIHERFPFSRKREKKEVQEKEQFPVWRAGTPLP